MSFFLCKPDVITRCLLLLCLTLVVSCSSSELPPQLPDSELDIDAPILVEALPKVSDVIAANAVIQFDFSEVLDKNSLTDSVNIYALKLRDINTSATADSSKFIVTDSDLRNKNLSVADRLITVTETVVVNETIDEDDFLITETIDVQNEIFVTRVRVGPGDGRFPLASLRSIVFSREVKDVSENDSINPITNEASTGNFLESDVLYSFGIGDGEFQAKNDVNTSFLFGSNSVGPTHFESLQNAGYLLWEQLFEDDVGDQVSALFSKGFDYSLQTFDSAPYRVDYIAALDSATSTLKSTVIDSSSDSFGETMCITWSNENGDTPTPLHQSIMVRCGNGIDYGERVVLDTFSLGSQISLLKILVLSDNHAFVSYVADNKHYIHDLSVDNTDVSMTDTITFGGGATIVNDVALTSVRRSNGTEQVVALVSVVETTAQPVARYQLISNEIALKGGVNLVNSLTLATSESSFSQLSVGFDQFGSGLGGWVQGVGNQQRLYTSRYDGNVWRSAVGVVKDGRGPITEGGVHVFEDGQSVFFWVQDIGTENQLMVQGLFEAAPFGGFSRPAPLMIDSSLGSISSVSFSGDREGNGFLLYDKAGSQVFSSRFLHNTLWDDAWSSPNLVSSEASVSALTASQILNDGRMVFAYPKNSAPYSTLETQVFSDY